MSLPNRIFVDTSYFVALLNSNDADHANALALQAALKPRRTRKVTSEFVLIELGDGLARLNYRHLASRLLHLVRRDPSFTAMPASSELYHRAVELFDDRADKEWGLTDCTSFVIMRELKIDAALSADHHFQQAGYRALLLEMPLPTPSPHQT